MMKAREKKRGRENSPSKFWRRQRIQVLLAVDASRETSLFFVGVVNYYLIGRFRSLISLFLSLRFLSTPMNRKLEESVGAKIKIKIAHDEAMASLASLSIDRSSSLPIQYRLETVVIRDDEADDNALGEFCKQYNVQLSESHIAQQCKYNSDPYRIFMATDKQRNFLRAVRIKFLVQPAVYLFQREREREREILYKKIRDKLGTKLQLDFSLIKYLITVLIPVSIF